MDRRWFLDNLWRRSAGLPELELTTHRVTAEQMERNWSARFVELMHNRMRLGIFRHGDFRDPRQPAYARVASAMRRIRSYERDGNLEHLVDAANLLMIEFEVGRHPKRHFLSLDDAEHTPILDPE